MEADSPRIAVEEFHRNRTADKGHWQFGWRIQNLTDATMDVLAARLPHGKFRSDEREFNPPLSLAVRGSIIVELPATCDEEPGTVVENAFIILLVDWLKHRWRIFVRLRIEINGEGEPETAMELITPQQVGFSRMV